MIRLLHVSDTHGRFPELPLDDIDIIVHSGDMLPNISWGDERVEKQYQPHWCRENEARFDEWRGGKPFVFCAGNHDFFTPKWPGLIDCSNKSVNVSGIRFYGFPWVPAFGTWAWGAEQSVLRRLFEAPRQAVEAGEVDVLVCHCPPFGVLDMCDRHIGNQALSFAMRHWTRKPKAILCGHVHECGGMAVDKCGILVSNAATTVRVVEIQC